MAVLLAFASGLAPAAAQEELVVGTKAAPPFSIQDSDGTWTGLSIDLWARVAKELDRVASPDARLRSRRFDRADVASSAAASERRRAASAASRARACCR